MPPSLVADRVTLRELADLAIGTPEVGAVNFTALHTLIVSMLKSLNLQEVLIDFQYPSVEPGRPTETIRSSFSVPHVPASKEKQEKRRSVFRLSVPQQSLENQVKDLGNLVQDLSKQIKTMDNKVQGLATQVDNISTDADIFQEFPRLEEDITLMGPQIPSTKPSRSYESTEVKERPEPTVGPPPRATQPRLSKTQKETVPAKVGILILQSLCSSSPPFSP